MDRRGRGSSVSKLATPKILKGYRREKTYVEIPVRRNVQNTKPKIIQETPEEKEIVKPEISITSQANKGNIDVSKQQLYETGEGTQSSPASLRTKNGKIHKKNDGNCSDEFVKTIYGCCSSKPPIRCYGKMDFNVNAYYGGCCALYFASCRNGVKGYKSSVELMLVRSGFDCNHVEVKSIATCRTGHFSASNSHMVDEEGTFIADCHYGYNHLMLLTNDSQFGNLRNGIFMKILDKEIPMLLPLSLSSNEDVDQQLGSGLSLIICSGNEGVSFISALYVIRLGTSNMEFQAKIISGDDKFDFDVREDGILTVTGPTGSQFGIFHNRDNLPSMPSHVYVSQTQCLDGTHTLMKNIADQSTSTLVVLCSNSYGTQDCTISSVYHLSINEGNLTVKELSGCHGPDCKKSDLWMFELVGGQLLVVGPTGPCKYAVLSNIKSSRNELMSTIKQDDCLATGERTKTEGNVAVTLQGITGEVSKPSIICIMMNHRTIRKISEDELVKQNDMYSFSCTWREQEMVPGYHMIRVYALRKHLESDEEMFIELSGSPFPLTRQKPGVVYALNCAGPAYQDMNDIVYSSEHKQFANFSNGMRSKAEGDIQTHTMLPASMLKSHDGFLYTVTRTACTEEDSGRGFTYMVHDLPNGKYRLRLHMTNIAKHMTFNDRDINDEIKKEIMMTMRPGDKSGQTCYCIDIPVEITNNTLQLESKGGDVPEDSDQLCAFALLDSTYKDKVPTKIQLRAETEEKQKLADEVPPLNTITTRKDITIVGYSPNLLENATGENGDMKHWTVEGNIKVCDGGYDTDTCFVTSDVWCSKYQEVDLLKHFTSEYLDTAPDIMILEDYKEGNSGGGFYCFTAQLLSEDRKILKEYTTGQLGPLYYLKEEWEEANVVFSDYGPGVRIVAFSSKGRDNINKTGHFGPYISGAEVRVRRESTGPAIDDSYTDIPKIKKYDKKTNLEKLVNKILRDNHELMTDFMKEEDPQINNQLLETQISQTETPVLSSYWNTVKMYLLQKKQNFKKKLQKKREIRVFVSSTFKDFYKERDEIIKKTFREINRLCTDRGVFFTYVDLRWGITSEQASDGKTIAICLQEIERCRPYFICLMGERFGWSQRKGEDDDVLNMTYDYAIENYPNLKWIDEYRYDSSVTQLEVFHGILNNPNVDHEKCFVYMRHPPSKTELSEIEYKKLSSESEWHHERQEWLKSQVKQQPGINVSTFKTPTEVAELIQKDLERCIDVEFPKGTELTQLEVMREAHSAFASARQRVYIGSQDYFTEIHKYRNENITQPFVILGESGSGKSSLIANWAKQVEDTEPDTFVFVHFIGSSADSSDYLKLIRRLFEEMKVFFDFDMNIPSSDTILINEIGQWLRMAGSNTKVVIVLDALNQLDDGTGEHGSEHDLLWIPSEIPPNVFLLMSTLPGRAMNACVRNKWPSMKVKPLEDSQKMQIITDYLERIYGKTLNKEQKEMVVNVKQTSNPLYLKSLLDEIRMFGLFRKLTEKIEEYLKAENPQELFAKILGRLENDFENGTHSRKNLVHDVTTALWCSNRGMSESELVEMLDLPSVIWSPFYLSLYENLVNRNGILNFFHDHLRQAVEKKYLSSPEAKTKGYLRLAKYFSSKETSNRTVEELPYLWTKAGELDKLKATITDLGVFYRLADDEDGIFELIKAWRRLGGFSLSEEAYMSQLLKIPKSSVMGNLTYYCRLYSLLGNFFSTLGLIEAAKKVYKTLIKILELNFDEVHDTIVYSAFDQSWKYRCNHPVVIKSLQDLGTVYTKLGRKDKAISVYIDAICRQNRIETPTQKLRLCDGLLGLSAVYVQKDDMLEAKKLMTRALELATSVLGKKHHFVADIYTKLGQLAYKQHRLDEALANFLQDLKATCNEFGTNHPFTANILNEIGLVYDDKNDEIAGQLYEAALRITLDTYGNNYLVTGTIRYNLGAFYYGTDRFKKASFQFAESYKIYVMFLGDDHPDTISVKHALDLVADAMPEIKQDSLV